MQNLGTLHTPLDLIFLLACMLAIRCFRYSAILLWLVKNERPVCSVIILEKGRQSLCAYCPAKGEDPHHRSSFCQYGPLSHAGALRLPSHHRSEDAFIPSIFHSPTPRESFLTLCCHCLERLSRETMMDILSPACPRSAMH